MLFWFLVYKEYQRSFQMLTWLSSLAFVTLAAAQWKAKIPCGLPPFVTKLPTKQADQLREVWANYQNGTACVDEQKRTFEIVASLTEAERAAVFESNVEPGAGPVEGLSFGFLFKLTIILIPHLDSLECSRQLFKEGFDAIWMNSTIPNDEKYKLLREYAEKNFNAEQKEGFEEWLPR
ncbi:hypothetical protein COOONC_19452 [Cooperia oncophora]